MTEKKKSTIVNNTDSVMPSEYSIKETSEMKEQTTLNTQRRKNKIENAIDFEEFENEINVGYYHKYKTIQSAIDAAPPKTKIIIHPGIYRESIVITNKGDLDIISFNSLMPAIIMTQNDPGIRIFNLQPGAAIKIVGLRILYRGMKDTASKMNKMVTDETTNNDVSYNTIINKSNNNSVHKKEKQSKTYLNQFYTNTYEIENLDLIEDIDVSLIDGIMLDNRGYYSAMLIINATVMILNSQITVAYLTAETTKIIPGVYAEHATVFMDGVLIKGNSTFQTCGVLSFLCNLKMTNSEVTNHRSGGILATVSKNNHVVISKCYLANNIGCGLYVFNRDKKHEKKKEDSFLVRFAKKEEKKYEEEIEEDDIEDLEGEEDEEVEEEDYNNEDNEISLNNKKKEKTNQSKNDLYVESNLIESNQGAGCKIENCVNVCVITNKFFENKGNGLELIHSDGLCVLNEMVKNGSDGLMIKAKIMPIELKVSKNVFCENLKNGISVLGEKNVAQLIKNEKITGNYLAGIRIYEKAHPIIKENSVYGNLYQGILICQDSSAEIEENEFYGNLKACIAFGGEGAKDVRIIGNKIYRGRSEGIFIIDGTGGLIARNKIFENNDGIIMFNSKNVEVSENDIYQNIR